MPWDVPPSPGTNIRSANGSDDGAYTSERPSLLTGGSVVPLLWRNSLAKVDPGVTALTLVSRDSAAIVEGSELVGPDAREVVSGRFLVNDDLGCFNSSPNF